jgi:hypothetical protein
VNKYRFCISVLFVLLATIVVTLEAASSTNSLSKIGLTAISSPPRSGLAWLIDHRFDPPRRYILKVGAATNGITVIRIDLQRLFVELALDGETNVVRVADRKQK